MSTKSWPQPPRINTLEDDGILPMTDRDSHGHVGQDIYGWGSPLPQTVCKHGEGSCEACGSTNRRDVVHETRGGRGAVGRLGGRR